MSGLYNVIFGTSGAAPLLLAALGLRREDTGRFRDCFLTPSGEIAVYTRNGGGNREEYQHVIDKLAEHPCYLRDVDDDFDNTYATIYFKVPETMDRAALAAIAPEMNRDEQWQLFLDALKRAPTPNGQ